MAWLCFWKDLRRRHFGGRHIAGCTLLFASGFALWLLSGPNAHSQVQQSSLISQTQADVEQKNAGCVSCHVSTDEPTMHPTRTVRLACTDCHGGDSTASLPAGTAENSATYEQTKRKAHPQPREAQLADSSANEVRPYTKWLRESYEYVRFVNPGDLRVAAQTCGTAGCHASEVLKVKSSMMTHGAMLWGAALYNNGSVPFKNARFGESYSADGLAQTVKTAPPPTPEETRLKGVLPELTPLDRWETSQPGNVLRVFERGGRKKGEIGNPNREEESGRPDDKLGERGFGTLLRTDPKRRVFSILFSRFPAPTISPVIFAAAAAQRVTWFTQTIVPRSTPPATRGMEIWERAPHRTPLFRGTSRDIRFTTRSRDRFRPANAWSAIFIRERIWKPRTSATPGGTTKRTANSCIRKRNGIRRKSRNMK
jgi:hypothetical protein